MFCPRCGKENNRVGKYCEFCGRETGFPEHAYTKRGTIRTAGGFYKPESPVAKEDALSPNASSLGNHTPAKRTNFKPVHAVLLGVCAAMVAIAVLVLTSVIFAQISDQSYVSDLNDIQKPIIAFDFWGLPIYLIMAVTGIFSVWLIVTSKLRRLGYNVVYRCKVKRSLWIAALSGILCANIANWLLFPNTMQYPILQRLTEGGFSFYYGMFSFFAVAALLFRLHKLDVSYWINEIIPAFLLFHAIGRVGCSLTGCCYGVEMSMFGLNFDFPAREIEAVCLFLMAGLFSRVINKNRMFWYLGCYSVLRFLLEFGRADNRGNLFQSWLSPAQITSVAVWAGLAVYMFVKKYTGSVANGHVPAELSSATNRTMKPKNAMRWVACFTALALIATVIWNPLSWEWCNTIGQSILGFIDGFTKESSVTTTIGDSDGASVIMLINEPTVSSSKDALSVLAGFDKSIAAEYVENGTIDLANGDTAYLFLQSRDGKGVLGTGKVLVADKSGTAKYIAGETDLIPNSDTPVSLASPSSSDATITGLFGNDLSIISEKEFLLACASGMRQAEHVIFQLNPQTSMGAVVDSQTQQVMLLTGNQPGCIGIKSDMLSIRTATDAYMKLSSEEECGSIIKEINAGGESRFKYPEYYFDSKITFRDYMQDMAQNLSTGCNSQILKKVFACILEKTDVQGKEFAAILESAAQISECVPKINFYLFKELVVESGRSFYLNNGAGAREADKRANDIKDAFNAVGIGNSIDKALVAADMKEKEAVVTGYMAYSGDSDQIVIHSKPNYTQEISIKTDAPVTVTLIDGQNDTVFSLPVFEEERFVYSPDDGEELYLRISAGDTFKTTSGADGRYTVSMKPTSLEDSIPNFIYPTLNKIEQAYNNSDSGKFLSLCRWDEVGEEYLAPLMGSLLKISESCANILDRGDLLDTSKGAIASVLLSGDFGETVMQLKGTKLSLTYIGSVETDNGAVVKAKVSIAHPGSFEVLSGYTFFEVKHFSESSTYAGTEGDELANMLKKFVPAAGAGYYISEFNTDALLNAFGDTADSIKDTNRLGSIYGCWENEERIYGNLIVTLKKIDLAKAKNENFSQREIKGFEDFTKSYNKAQLIMARQILIGEEVVVSVVGELLGSGVEIAGNYGDYIELAYNYFAGEDLIIGAVNTIAGGAKATDDSGNETTVSKLLVDSLVDGYIRSPMGEAIVENENAILQIENDIKQIDPTYVFGNELSPEEKYFYRVNTKMIGNLSRFGATYYGNLNDIIGGIGSNDCYLTYSGDRAVVFLFDKQFTIDCSEAAHNTWKKAPVYNGRVVVKTISAYYTGSNILVRPEDISSITRNDIGWNPDARRDGCDMITYELGTARYIESLPQGHFPALKQMMDDVYSFESIKHYPTSIIRDDFWLRLCLEFNRRVVAEYGSGKFDMPSNTHYFRNELNRAPNTLDEMLELNRKISEKDKKWRLLCFENTAYHMIGGGDEFYNLKFVSYDGIFEAVYDKAGRLLTKDNPVSRINMGTYNYSDPANSKMHGILDVATYSIYGNVDPDDPRMPESSWDGMDDFLQWLGWTGSFSDALSYVVAIYRDKFGWKQEWLGDVDFNDVSLYRKQIREKCKGAGITIDIQLLFDRLQ